MKVTKLFESIHDLLLFHTLYILEKGPREVSVISDFNTLGTHVDSVISDFSTLGTHVDSVISDFSSLGTREDSVISACGTLETQCFKVTHIGDSMTEFQ